MCQLILLQIVASSVNGGGGGGGGGWNNRKKGGNRKRTAFPNICRCATIAQSIQLLTAEWEDVGSTLGLHEHSVSTLQMARPSRGLDDHIEMVVPSPVGDIKTVS